MTARIVAARANMRRGRVRRTQADRRAEAESRMIAAAVKLVAQKGLASLTLAAVGTAAGYSRGLPTHHFRTRAALVASLTESIVQSYVGRVQAQLPNRSPLEGLLSAIGYYLEDVDRDRVQWKSFFAIAHAALNDRDAADALRKVNARAIKGFERSIRAAMQAKEVAADIDPGAEAALILASLRGLSFAALTDVRQRGLLQARKTFIASVRRRLQG